MLKQRDTIFIKPKIRICKSNTLVFWIFVMCNCLFFNTPSLCNSIELTKDFSSISLNEHMQYYEDSVHEITIQNIDKADFKPLESKSINFGISNSTFWFKTVIHNTSNKDLTVCLLNYYRYIDTCNFYVYSDSVIDMYATGIESPNMNNQVLFIIRAQSKLNIATKVKSNSPLGINLAIYNQGKIHQIRKVENIFTGAFLGIFISMVLVTFLISAVIKENMYLYFGLYILAFSVFLMGLEGLLPKKEFLDHFGFFQKASVAAVPVSQLFYIFFSKIILDFSNKYKIQKALLNLLLIISSIQLLIFLFSFKYGLQLIFFLTPIVSFVVVLVSVHSWLILGKKFIRIYVFASLTLHIGICIQVLANLGIIFDYQFSFTFLKITFFLHVSVFAYALTRQFIDYRRKFTKTLNKKVEERTMELEDALLRLKTRRQQLIQSEKMASVGILTAGLAHELNNPLNFISGGMEIINCENSPKSKNFNPLIDEALKFIKNGLERSTEIVSSILQFSHNSEQPPEPSDIETIINRTLFVLKPMQGPNISIKKNYSLSIKIPVYKAKIHQVFINLLDNAFHFVKGAENSQEVIISTQRIDDIAEIRIFNSGKGIPSEDLIAIFDPFFSTRDVGLGTGLGLSTSLKIIQEHKGSIEAINEDNGVSFVIRLPI